MSILSPFAYRVPFLLVQQVAQLISIVSPTKSPSIEEQKRYASVNKGSPVEPLVAIWSRYRNMIVVACFCCPVVLSFLTSLSLRQLGAHSFHLLDILACSGILSKIPYLGNVLAPRPALHHMNASPTLIVGTFLCIVGCVIRVAAYSALGQFFTFELALKDGHKLITHGPFAFVRHPAYTGLALVKIGMVLSDFGLGSWWYAVTALRSWPSVGCVQLIAAMYITEPMFCLVLMMTRMPKEDRILREAFGEQWVEWAKRVPHRILPGIY